MCAPFGEPRRFAQVAIEHGREGIAVRHVKITLRGDGDVKLDGVDRSAKDAGAAPAIEKVGEGREQRQCQAPNGPRLFHKTSAQQILIVEQRDVIAVLAEKREGEIDEAPHALDRLDISEIELPLFGAHLGVNAVQDGGIKTLLVAKVVIKQAHIGAAAP